MVFKVPADENGLGALRTLRALINGRVWAAGQAPVAVAILLHDPDQDLELDELLPWHLASIDGDSGEYLHFFCLGASNDSFFRTDREARRSPRASDLRRTEIEEWLSRDEPAQRFGPTAYENSWRLALSSVFDIDIDQLPGLLVFCPQDPSRSTTHTRPPILTYIRVDHQNFRSIVKLCISRAKDLADEQCDESDFHSDLPGWQIAHLFDALPDSILDPGRPAARERRSLPPHAMVGWAGLRMLQPVARESRTQSSSLLRHLERWSQYADQDTLVVFRTAEALWRAAALDARHHPWDWSAVVGQLAKGFERLIAGSVIHAARRAHGIDLPRWYRLHDPDAEATEGRFDLNSKRGTAGGKAGRPLVPWKGPTIGDAKQIYELCKKSGHLDLQILRPMEKQFLKLWQRVAEVRNPFVHETIARREDALEMAELLGDLAKLGVPESLGAIRREFEPQRFEAEMPPRSDLRWRARLFAPRSQSPIDLPSGRIEWRWVVADEGAPYRLALELVEPIQFDLAAIDLPSGRLGDLARAAVAIVALRREPLLTKLIDGHREVQNCFGEQIRVETTRRLGLLKAELTSASASRSALDSVLFRRGAILDVLAPIAASLRAEALEQEVTFRTAVEWWGAADLPEAAWLIQRTSVKSAVGRLSVESTAHGPDVLTLVDAVESAILAPEDAISRVFDIFGLGADTSDLPSGTSKEIAQLIGAVRYWTKALVAMRERDGAIGGEVLPLFLARAASQVANQPDEALQTAILDESAGPFEADPEASIVSANMRAMAAQVERDRVALVERLCMALTGAR